MERKHGRNTGIIQFGMGTEHIILSIKISELSAL
jgi:hypothetical protein